MGKQQRWTLIALAGAATVAVLAAEPGSDEKRAATPSVEPRAPPAAQPAPIDVALFDALPKREGIGEPRGQLFAPRSWAPPPPKPPPAVQPQPSAAPPPNPYRFAGRAVENSETTIFLAAGDRLYEAKAGQTLDGGFRVESVADDAVVLVNGGARHRIAIDSRLVVEDDVAQRGAETAGLDTTTGAGW